MNKPFAVGIIGPGAIAHKMAHTLRDMEGVELHAVASRSQEKAEAFMATMEATSSKPTGLV